MVFWNFSIFVFMLQYGVWSSIKKNEREREIGEFQVELSLLFGD